MKDLVESRQTFAKNIKNVENIYGTSSKEYKKSSDSVEIFVL